MGQWRRSALLLAVFLWCCYCWTPALSLHTDQCEAVTREVDVNPKADAVISAILAVRRPASEDGLFACGPPQRESVEVFEAMRWATERLNGRQGNGQDHNNSSFIPGITFGLRVLDTCGHGSSRDRLLAEAFPVLRDGPAPCTANQADSSDPTRPPLALGLAFGDSGAPKALLQRYHIPTLELDPVGLVPPEDRAKALIMLAQQLDWARVAVLYSSADDYSAAMFRSVVRLSSDAGVCLLSAGDVAEDAADAGRPDGALQRALSSLLTSSPSPLGALVLLRPSALEPLMRALGEEDPDEARRVKWLFAWPLHGEQLDKMADREIFAVALSPAAMPEFEAYWQRRRKADLNRMDADARWLAEYEMTRRGCKLPGWAGPGISHLPKCHNMQGPTEEREGPEEALARASSAAAGLHVVQTFAHAFRKAWEDKCGRDKGPGGKGPCRALAAMQRKEFEESYLRPLEFEHRGFIRGGKLKMSDPSRLAAARMGLIAYRRGLHGEIIPKEVYAYHLEAVEVLDVGFHPEAIPSAPDDQQPGRCLRVREGRVEGGRQMGDSVKAKHQPMTLIPSPNNVYVAGIFSLRSPGPGQLDCGAEVNTDAVRQVEAFLWAVRRFNERQEPSSSGPRLGAILLDTCSSKVRALTLPAGLLSAGGPHVIAAVNALPLPDVEASAGVLAALNVSSVATAEASATPEPRSHFSLQVEAPLSVISDSIVKILQYLGWSYVSLVYSDGDPASEAGVRSFREAADASGVCVSLELPVSGRRPLDNGTAHGLAGDLVGARAAGARGVVLWTNVEDTREVMRAMSTAHALGTLRREDVFWLVASPGGEAREAFEEYGNAVGGALLFSPQHRPVREFLQHLRRVRPSGRSETENPWLKHYVREFLQCADPVCRRVLEGGRPADSNTVQAVYAIGSAALRARKELCPTSKLSMDSLCPSSSKNDRTDANRAVNAYLRYSTSEKADGMTSGEEFRLTAGGYGDVPIEISNFRRGPRGRSRSLGNVYYESVGLFQQQQLKTLTNMVAYRDSGDELQVSTLASQCAKHCQRCRHRSMDRMTTTTDATHSRGQKSETFYLAAALGVHEPSPRPLECSGEVSAEGMLQLEALLWAVEQANKNGSLLPPSVRLEVIAMDTCGSAQKTSRDVANLIGEAEVGAIDKGRSGAKSSPMASRMVAFVAAGGTELTKPAVDILAPLGVAILAPEATGSVLRMRKKHAPYPLRLSPGNAARASALMALLSRLQWTSFSTIFLEDGVEYEDVFRLVEKEARGRGLKMVASAGLPLTELGDEAGVRATREALRTVERLRAEGVKAVLLLLPPKEVDLVLTTAREMRAKGQMAPGGITWVGLGAEDVFENHRDQAQGALILRPKVGWVEEFEKHFKDLNVTSNMRNPWFSDFWASVFHCRGAACRSGLYRNLHSYHVKRNPYVVNTINAVFSIAHALESVHRELCPDHLAGLCRAMKDVGRVKRRLFEVAPKMAFVGAGLNGIAFTQGGENSHAAMEILNVRQVGSAVWGIVPIGSISPPAMTQSSAGSQEDSGNDLVHLDVSKAKAYEMENSKTKEIPITEVMSQCASCDDQESHWDDGISKHTMAYKQNFMEVVSNRRFSILAFLPIHEEGANYLHCGAFKSLAIYKTAAAFSFALERINKNTSILPGIKLGALLWDYCSQPARAHDRLFAFLSRNSEAVATPESALASLVIGAQTAETLAPLLQAQRIPEIVGYIDRKSVVEGSSGTNPDEPSNSSAFHLSVDETGEVDALIRVMQMLNWEYIALVHSATARGERLAKAMKMKAMEGEICIGATHSVSKGDEEIAMVVQMLKQLPPTATIVTLLLDTPEETTALLDAVGKQGGLRERFLFLGGRGWGVGKGSEQISAGSIVVGEEEWEVPGFEEYFQSLLMTNLTSRNPFSAPLPRMWTLEAQTALSDCVDASCSGLDPIGGPGHSSIYLSMVKAISTIATTLHRFLEKDCPHRFDTNSISSCGHRARERLADEIRSALREDGLGQLVVWNVQGGEMVKVGRWSPSKGLELDADRLRFRHGSRLAPSAQCSSGACVRVCAGQMPQFAAKASTLPVRPQPLEGAGTLEGVVCSALTVFGLLMALVAFALQCTGHQCTEGSRLIRQSTTPSFPLNFVVLVGIIVLFGSNFAFILSPNEVICSTRRSLPGIAYAIIFSGLLVEVVDRWRRDKSLKKNGGSCHPFGLLTSALTLVLVQAFLVTGWLLLVPSSIQPIDGASTMGIGSKEEEEAPSERPLWRCSPSSTFEAHLLISMTYDALLLFATMVLALIVRRQGRRQEVFMGAGKKKERRKSTGAVVEGEIVACCMVTWVAWLAGIAALLLLPVHRRDLVIVAMDLVAGVVTLCVLYARDAYSAGRKKHKDETVGITSIPGLNGRFPYPQPIFSISHFKAQHGFAAVTEPPAGPMEEDPTQVIPSLLYPLDMFSYASPSMDDCEEDELQGLGEDDDDEMQEGRINETFEDGTNPDDDIPDDWSDNIVPGLIPGRKTRPNLREHGVNEFLASEDDGEDPIPRSLMATIKKRADKLDPFSL